MPDPSVLVRIALHMVTPTGAPAATVLGGAIVASLMPAARAACVDVLRREPVPR